MTYLALYTQLDQLDVPEMAAWALRKHNEHAGEVHDDWYSADRDAYERDDD